MGGPLDCVSPYVLLDEKSNSQLIEDVGLGLLEQTPLGIGEAFMEFAGRREVSLHYGAKELQEDRRTLQRFQP